MSIHSAFLSIFLLVIAAPYLPAQLPDSLTEKACAITNTSLDSLVIENTGLARWTTRETITVLSAGCETCGLNISVNSFSRLKSVSAEVYDLQGKLLQKATRRDLVSVSNISNYSLYEDSKVLTWNPSGFAPPFVIRYEYELELNNLMILPGWYPHRSSCFAIEEASLIVRYPDSLPVRFLPIPSPSDFEVQKLADGFSIQCASVAPIQNEPHGPHISEQFLRVALSPAEFTAGGIRGSYSSWNEYGNWYAKLLDGTQTLTTPLKILADSLRSSIRDTLRLIREIYRHTQHTKRYMSIQEGMGGWKPDPVAKVEELGYGDCKALSNYTASLLACAGIRAYPALIRAGRESPAFYADFPSNQFNHMILCVPLRKDTVWLECTSPDIPAGYLGAFTSGRPALLITERGGKLVRTPDLLPEDNLEFRSGQFLVDTLGSITGSFIHMVRGEHFADYLPLLKAQQTERIKALQHKLQVSGLQIVRCSVSQPHPDSAVIQVGLEIKAARYGTHSGKRVFFNPNFENRCTLSAAEKKKRETTFVIRTPSASEDSLVFTIPEGFEPEYLPGIKNLTGEYGSYTSSVEWRDGKIIYHRKYTQRAGRWSPDEHQQWLQWMQQAATFDQEQIVLVKKT